MKIHLLQEQATRKLILETWQVTFQENERMIQLWHARAEEKHLLVSQVCHTLHSIFIFIFY